MNQKRQISSKNKFISSSFKTTCTTREESSVEPTNDLKEKNHSLSQLHQSFTRFKRSESETIVKKSNKFVIRSQPVSPKESLNKMNSSKNAGFYRLSDIQALAMKTKQQQVPTDKIKNLVEKLKNRKYFQDDLNSCLGKVYTSNFKKKFLSCYRKMIKASKTTNLRLRGDTIR